VAKIRAYKLAEELGLDKAEFLEKAAQIGIELRSHLVGVDEDQAETLRYRLGAGVPQDREDKRIGSSVIRRRRRKVSPESAEPEPLSVPEPAELGPVELESPEIAGAEAEVPPPEVPEVPAVEPVQPPSEGVAPDETLEKPEEGGAVPADDAKERPKPVGPHPITRRKVLEGVTIREQEKLRRTLRGNVQQRLEQRRLVVERQSRLQSIHRKRGRGAKKVMRAKPGPRKMKIRLTGSLPFADLSKQTGVKLRELMRRARSLGLELERDAMVDIDAAQLLAEDVGFEIERAERDLEKLAIGDRTALDADLQLRPPIVTVMGHVDHGKTTLLDTIRSTHVVEGEAGGITQHIGAYQVMAGGHAITFIDTPGHAAFTQMRARGAQLTDIVVLVVAADDGIMPQTTEAIDHVQAAGVPMVVAINKIDRPDASVQRVKQALLEHDVVVEDFGGNTISVEISAKLGDNIDKLLDMLVLQAEVLELRASSKGTASGTVLEATLDRGRGPLATVLVQQGTLNRGDAVAIGEVYGRVRSLVNDQGETVKSAGPAAPVQLVGLSGVPQAGETMVVVKNEREAKNLVEFRVAEQRRALGEDAGAVAPPEAEDVFALLDPVEKRELKLVLKADVRGTMEAVRESAMELANDEVDLTVIHAGVGGITESDVMLAAASDAMVIGFHVRPEPVARRVAEREHVSIRTFDIVYELLDDLKALTLGMLAPIVVEKVSGHAEVRELFVIPRFGTVAGCRVPEGTIRRTDRIRIVRDGVPIYTGKVVSLRRFKDDVREVTAGLECGIKVENFDDVKVGDILESFTVEETRRTS